jgi:hypothetical protein
LEAGDLPKVLAMLAERAITAVAAGDSPSRIGFDAVLDCQPDGRWTWEGSRGSSAARGG